MFETERFIEACREAVKNPDTRALKEVVERAVIEPGQIVKALGEPKRAGIGTLHQSDDLTVLNIIWGPGMTLHPHDHRMLAVIGLYGGQENNTFYKRSEGGLREQGGKVSGVLSKADGKPLCRLTFEQKGALRVFLRRAVFRACVSQAAIAASSASVAAAPGSSASVTATRLWPRRSRRIRRPRASPRRSLPRGRRRGLISARFPATRAGEAA